MPSNDPMRNQVPERSFGHCRWCGTDDTRLHYLMCGDCYRIANMIPSKAQVLLNRPDLKKKYKEIGATIKNVASDLRRFLSDPKCRFPHEEGDKKHWQKMQDEAAQLASPTEVNQHLKYMQERGVDPLPDHEEMERQVGLDNTLRFILRVGVLRGVLKMEVDQDDVDLFKKMIEYCMENAISDEINLDSGESMPQAEAKQRLGMATRDLVMKRRK